MREFQMTDDDLKGLLEACKPVPYLCFGGFPPRSQQDNANVAWQILGKKLGFVSSTVMPHPSGDMKRFFAEPIITKPPAESEAALDAGAAKMAT